MHILGCPQYVLVSLEYVKGQHAQLEFSLSLCCSRKSFLFLYKFEQAVKKRAEIKNLRLVGKCWLPLFVYFNL